MAPEKTNFTQTCNLLSQYLKGRGSFGDIKLGISGKLETKGPETSRPPAAIMNLLPNTEISASLKFKDSSPQFLGFGSPNSIEDITNKADLRKSSTTDPGTAQMTIFYAGQVIVFNDFPVDKAKGIMDFASNGSSNSSPNGFLSTSSMDKINSTNSVALSNSQEPLQFPPQANGSGLPLAPRASLRRFFEKRKDRIAAKAPYQVHNPSPAAPRKPVESSPGLDLDDQSSEELELKL